MPALNTELFSNVDIEALFKLWKRTLIANRRVHTRHFWGWGGQAVGNSVFSLPLYRPGEEAPRPQRLWWDGQVMYHWVMARLSLSTKWSQTSFLVWACYPGGSLSESESNSASVLARKARHVRKEWISEIIIQCPHFQRGKILRG